MNNLLVMVMFLLHQMPFILTSENSSSALDGSDNTLTQLSKRVKDNMKPIYHGIQDSSKCIILTLDRVLDLSTVTTVTTASNSEQLQNTAVRSEHEDCKQVLSVSSTSLHQRTLTIPTVESTSSNVSKSCHRSDTEQLQNIKPVSNDMKETKKISPSLHDDQVDDDLSSLHNISTTTESVSLISDFDFEEGWEDFDHSMLDELEKEFDTNSTTENDEFLKPNDGLLGLKNESKHAEPVCTSSHTTSTHSLVRNNDMNATSCTGTSASFASSVGMEIEQDIFEHEHAGKVISDRKPLSDLQNTVTSDTPTPSQEWICQYDASAGKHIYVHKRTGNTCFNPPVTQTNTIDQDEQTTDTSSCQQNKPHPCASHLSHNCTPWLPRNKRKRLTNKGDYTNEGPELDQENLGSQSVDGLTKWRNVPGMVDTMFQNWNNPVFPVQTQIATEFNNKHKDRNHVRVHNVLHSHVFSKDMLKDLEVMGQVDDKFIACIFKNISSGDIRDDKDLLVLVDQHAAHERVRLEQLQTDLYNDSEKSQVKPYVVSPSLEIDLTSEQVNLLVTYKDEVKRFGVHFSTSKPTTLRVSHLPLAFMERNISKEIKTCLSVSPSVVQDLFTEFVEIISKTSARSTVLPRTISNVLNSQACHGAIKFGDPLSLTQCQDLISSLSMCNFPFQCAHGRPSIIPLVDLEMMQRNVPKQGNARLCLRNIHRNIDMGT